jgi:hypothetical protein
MNRAQDRGIYRRYAITDEAMLQQTGAKLSALQRSWVKSGQSQTARKLPSNSRKVPRMRRLGWRRRPDLNRRVEVLQGEQAIQTNRLQTP